MPLLNPTSCLYGGKTTLTYDSEGIDVYVYITGAGAKPSDNEYTNILVDEPYEPAPTKRRIKADGKWGVPFTGETEIYLQKVMGGQYQNLPPSIQPDHYTLNIAKIVNGEWFILETESFTIGPVPYSLDTNKMILTHNSTIDPSPPTLVYIQLSPAPAERLPEYPIPVWSVTYSPNELAPSADQITEKPLWTDPTIPLTVNFVNPLSIYLETPTEQGVVYLPNNNYRLLITDYLQIYYDTSFVVIQPTILIENQPNGTSIKLSVFNFPQHGYVSIHSGVPGSNLLDDSNLLDWGETYQDENGTTSTSLHHVWNWQFTDSKMDILLELVQVTENPVSGGPDVVTPYAPGTNYYVRLTDYRNLTKTAPFMVPSPTIQRNKPTYVYTENIVFTTTGSRNGTAVFMNCLTFSTSVGTINSGTCSTTVPPLLSSTESLPTTVFYYEAFTGQCNGATSFTFQIQKPTNPVELAPSYADGETITITGFTGTSIYLVMKDATNTYYLEKTNGNIILNGQDALSSLNPTATAKTLSDFYDEDIFIAGVAKVSTVFTFTALPKSLELDGTSPYGYNATIGLTSSGIDLGKAVTLYSPDSTSNGRYNASLGTLTASVSFVPNNIATVTNGTVTLPLTVFVSTNMFLCECDGATTNSFAIDPPTTVISTDTSYVIGDSVSLTGLTTGENVYLVTTKNSKRYYHSYAQSSGETTLNVPLTTVQLQNVYSSTDLITLSGDPTQTYYFACGSAASISFTITAQPTLIRDATGDTYAYGDQINLTSTNIADTTQVFMKDDTTQDYSVALAPINSNKSINLAFPPTLTKSGTPYPRTLFVNQDFVCTSDTATTDPFQFTPPVGTISTESGYVVTDTIDLTGLTSTDVYLVCEEPRLYKKYTATGTSYTIQLSNVIEFTDLYSNTITVITALYGKNFFIANGNNVSSLFNIVETATITSQSNSYAYNEPIVLITAGLSGPPELFSKEYTYTYLGFYYITLNSIVNNTYTSTTPIPKTLDFIQTASPLPTTVFTLFPSLTTFTAGFSSRSVFTSVPFEIKAPIATTGFSSSYPIDTTVTFPSGFSSTICYLVVNNSDTVYVCPSDTSTSITLTSTTELFSLYATDTKITLGTLPADTPFYIAGIDKVSSPFTITAATPGLVNTKTPYVYTEHIVLSSSGITGDVFLYNGQNDEYTSASIATITTGQGVSKLITEIGNLTNVTLSTLPLSVFTVFTGSAAKFKAGCGTSFTSLFTISPPTAITGFSTSYLIDTTVIFPTEFTSTTNYLVVDTGSGGIYYCAAGTGSVDLSNDKSLFSLYSTTTIQIGTAGTNSMFYIAGSNQVSSGFFITNGSSNISRQWDTVYEDNMALMKAGLYNTTTDYVYAYLPSPKPESIAGYATGTSTPLPPTISDPDNPSSSTNRIVLSIDPATSRLTYGASTGDLGINNGEYFLTLNQYIRINSPHFMFNGGNQKDVIVKTDTDISTSNKKFTVLNYTSSATGPICNYVATSDIVDIVESTDQYYYFVDFVCTLPTIVGTAPNGNPWLGNVYPQKTLYTNGDENAIASGVLFTGEVGDIYPLSVDGYNDHSIGDGIKWPISTLGTHFVMRIPPTNTDGTDRYKGGADINLQWGGPGEFTASVQSIQKKVQGDCSLVISIPSSGPFSAEIFDGAEPENLLTNHFVASNQCAFKDLFQIPTISLEAVRYSDLPSLSNKGYYLPTMIPGGDYKNVYDASTDTLSVTFMNGSEGKMTADRCRQPWRLSHYVRSNDTVKDIEVLKIAYNTAAALVYAAAQDSYYVDASKPGRLTLNVNIWNLYNSPDGYSGDMIPPLLALIDALEFKSYPGLESAITGYSTAIKDLGKTLSLQDLINSLTSGSPIPQSEVYPLLDSMGSGGQQLGLAGCGFICTKDFLARDNFNIMLKYDAITGWTTTGDISTPPPTAYFEPTHFDNLIQVYKMAATRGNGFQTAATWASTNITPNSSNDNKNYANLILSKAYLTNLRIRDVNVKMADELSFGPNFQGTQYEKGANENDPGLNHNCYLFYYDANEDPHTGTTAYGDPYVASSNYGGIVPTGPTQPPYVYTDFPMYGIPDSGWGSLTVEIFSYLGIVYVGMNDYQNFCKWHRTFWHLLFIQNGGNMYGWNTGEDSDEDKINLTQLDPPVQKIPPTDFWLPSYNNPGGDNGNWVNTVLNAKQLHSFDVYKFPPENHYPNGTPITGCITDYWANRYNPYRGNSDETSHVPWTTPSYCMGYSPAWVAGGKTDISTGFSNENNINRPIAEALNPMFTNTAGLYTATDGDENILQAYILASLQWPDAPPITSGDGFTGQQPTCPTATSGTGVYGYDCDVSDFNANTDIPDEPNYPDKKGVKYAATHQTVGQNPSNNNEPLYVTDMIGYGITTTNGTSWEFPTQPSPQYPNGERCTTWAYIAKCIQRTIISQRGNGWGPNFGNFTSLTGFPSSDPSIKGARFETLGHDTSASAGTTKLDYIDLRLYQVCEKVTTEAANA